MGQREILDVLKNKSKPMTSTEIQKEVKTRQSSVARCLKSLRNNGAVKADTKINPRNNRPYFIYRYDNNED